MLRDLFALAAVLGGYLLGLELIGRLPGALATWSRLTLPNLWLLTASAVPIWRGQLRFAIARGGRHAWPLAVISAAMAILVILAALAWAQERPLARLQNLEQTLASLLIVLLVPAAEELFFRGLLLDRLVHVSGRLGAALLVSALFGLLHHLQALVLPMTALSLALCGATLITCSLLWAIALHLGWNALAQLRQAPLIGAGRWIVTALALVALLILVLRGLATRERAGAQTEMPAPTGRC